MLKWGDNMHKKIKVIVMSDSHRRYGIVDEVMNAHPDAYAYIHCGDLQEDRRRYPALIVVKGNGDYDPTMLKEMCLTIHGHRIYITHSHLFPYYQKLQHLVSKAKQEQCDIVLYGHTHIPYMEEISGVTIINPGSLYYNRDYSKPSYVILTLSDKVEVEFVHVD